MSHVSPSLSSRHPYQTLNWSKLCAFNCINIWKVGLYLKAVVRRLCSLFLQGWCFHHALMAVKCLDLQWQLRPETSVTSDLWGMDKPGNKNRSLLCGSKGKHLLCAEDTERRRGGGLTPRYSSFGLFSHLRWEVPGGNVQKATVHSIITSEIPPPHSSR